MAFFCIHCKSEIDPKFKACPFCGEAITDFLRRHLEMPIDGKYQILARLGVGGMGEVYKVLHTHLNSIRVIKLMRSNIASDPGAHERFLREARLATKIHHANVATLFDFSMLEDGSHYMVWEYIEGTNLHELIDQRGPLSPRYAARLASQALMGLDAIHRAGIVHRDISPENLMITRDDENDERVKIIDLGIAKSADDDKTKTGMFVGKWKYCSPEHLGMLPPGERIDGRADLYSFGIVLYEMLTGVPPFQADTPHAYLMMHSQQQPKALRATNPSIAAAPELEALLFRALAKDRNQRFATAREFAQAIDRIAPTLSEEGGAPPPLPANAEITDNATRVANAATIVSIAQDAATVVTADLKPLVRNAGVRSAGPAASRRGAPVVAMIATFVVALAAGAAWFKSRDTKEPILNPTPVVQAQTVPVLPTRTVQRTVQQAGRLAINAFPWATVTTIRNLDNNQELELASSLQTPTPIDLPPGRYEVTLTNPDYANAITRTVTIAEGAEATLNVAFRDPASAALPDFGGSR